MNSSGDCDMTNRVRSSGGDLGNLARTVTQSPPVFQALEMRMFLSSGKQELSSHRIVSWPLSGEIREAFQFLLLSASPSAENSQCVEAPYLKECVLSPISAHTMLYCFEQARLVLHDGPGTSFHDIHTLVLFNAYMKGRLDMHGHVAWWLETNAITGLYHSTTIWSWQGSTWPTQATTNCL